MATNQALAPASAPNVSFNFIRVLSLPWLDRAIAAIACVPLVYLAYYRYEHWHHGLPLIASALGVLILVATMIIRRPPKRVTPNPGYWLLAFAATYWQLLVLSLLQQGRPLGSNWITDAIAIAGLLVVIWARFSLGRNIGFVPAQRELVNSGAYAFMRHPVWSAHFSRLRAARLRPAKCTPVGPRSVLVYPGEKHCGGEFPACSSAICRVYEDRTRSLDSVLDLNESRTSNCRLRRIRNENTSCRCSYFAVHPSASVPSPGCQMSLVS